MSVIGDKIKRLREEKGLSQVDLANLIGESKQTIWKYENGIVTNIPLPKVEAIAKALGCSPEFLTGWVKESDGIEDDDLSSYLEELRTRPEMKMLFKTSKDMTKEQIQAVVQMIEGLTKNS